MADRTDEEAYARLLDILRDNGLSWIVAQIQEQVRSGKPATKSVNPFRETLSSMFAVEFDDIDSPIRQRRQRLAATNEYNATERLELVLQAIESAVFHVAEMEEAILEFSRSTRLESVQFAPDEFDDTPLFSIVEREPERLSALEQLRAAVVSIRNARDANN